jgi:hypothetical protein
MCARRYGPTNDAGTVIIEEESEKTITPSALGSTGFAGILERGKIGELITCVSKRDMLRKTGGYIPDSLLPDNNQDFWDHSEGAGVLFLCRVTDGNEVKASLTLLDRSDPRNPVMRFDTENGGGWGGRRDEAVLDLDAVPGDITDTTVTLPLAYIVAADYWKGATLTISEVTTKTYKVVSNTEGTGIVAAILTLKADSTALTDYGAGTDKEVILENSSVDAWGRERFVSVEIYDGELNPSTEFGCSIYVNGDLVRSYPDLNMDPNSDNYFVNLINEDTSNYYVRVTDLWSPNTVTANSRPANHYGIIPTAGITSTVLTLAVAIVDTSNIQGTSVLGAITFGSKVVRDRLKVTYDLVGTAWTVASQLKMVTKAFPDASGGVAYVADNDWSIGFMITETGPVDTEYFLVDIYPLRQDEAIGGKVYPDVDNAPNTWLRIFDNDETTVTIQVGDLTAEGSVADNYRLEFPQRLEAGYDGIAGIDVNDYLDCFDVDASPFNDTEEDDYGLIKFGTPAVYSDLSVAADGDTVQKAGVAYGDAKNHQFRLTLPSTVLDEVSAKSYVQDTLGKSDYESVSFPGYASVTDPVLTSRMKSIPQTGAILGRDARTARDWNGYHKVSAGVDVTFPRIRELPTGDTKLNGEILNPAGISRFIKKGGNFVLWGGRIPASDQAWKFKQHRELMSYYEQVLAINFDWLIFAINDEAEQPRALAALQSFFMPEWRKRALRGKTFKEAAILKIDEEINTDATRGAGDMFAEVKLKLADQVERFVITISKQGIFESVSAS